LRAFERAANARKARELAKRNLRGPGWTSIASFQRVQPKPKHPAALRLDRL